MVVPWRHFEEEHLFFLLGGDRSDTYWDFPRQNVIISISSTLYFFHKTAILVPNK